MCLPCGNEARLPIYNLVYCLIGLVVESVTANHDVHGSVPWSGNVIWIFYQEFGTIRL